MKITLKQIKKIILEELTKVLRESDEDPGNPQYETYEDFSNHPIKNLEELSEAYNNHGGEVELPWVWDGELMRVEFFNEPSVGELMHGGDYFTDLEDELKAQAIKLTGDDLKKFFNGDMTGIQIMDMLKSIIDEFEGFPEGELALDELGLGVETQWSGHTFVFSESMPKLNNQGFFETKFESFYSKSDFRGSFLDNEIDEEGNVLPGAKYVKYFAFPEDDYSGSLVLDIKKLMSDLTSGVLRATISESGGSIIYNVDTK